jgi:hypothetical protein
MVGHKTVEAEAKAKAKVGPEAKAEAHGRRRRRWRQGWSAARAVRESHGGNCDSFPLESGIALVSPTTVAVVVFKIQQRRRRKNQRTQ